MLNGLLRELNAVVAGGLADRSELRWGQENDICVIMTHMFDIGQGVNDRLFPLIREGV